MKRFLFLNISRVARSSRQNLLWLFLFVPFFSQAQQADSTFHKSLPDHLLLRGITPAGLILTGVLLNGNGAESPKNEVKEERDALMPHFHTKVDNYLQYAPIALAYGFDAFGMPSKTDLANRTAILLKSELLMTGAVTALKYSTHELRPDGSAHNSFPSGHTAQAFMAATFLTEEYGAKYKWSPYLAYGMATSVGVLRMANEKHYISDVLVGAGIGILSTEIAYLTHRYKWGNKAKKQVPQPL